MIIELRGVEFVNKGAELMLHAILAKVKREYPHIIFAMEHTSRAPRKKHLESGIYTISNIRKFNVNFGSLISFLPQFIRRKLFLVTGNEINVVFDSSGFAFGDQWGAAKAGFRLADHIAHWKKQGKKVVLLPQAFGPFTDTALREKMQTICEHADAIFARDIMSFQYLKDIPSASDNIYLKPDFTNLLFGAIPHYFDKSKYEIALIPNYKMIQHGSKEDGEKYLALLSKIITYSAKNGQKTFFLIHEGKKDVEIAEMVNSTLDHRIPILKEEDPISVKGIIGGCKSVVTSRFHGLVSCLSQGIPCLTTGWSHKYEMLLQDYNYAEGMIDVNMDDDEFVKKMDLLINMESQRAIHSKLIKNGKQQKSFSEEMWDQVFSIIAS